MDRDKLPMVDIDGTSTEEILAAIREDRDEVFTQLVAQFHAQMVSLAHSMLREHEAEEAVQDAWISAYKGIGNFEGRSSLRTWLSRIVINEARMRLRKTGREFNLDILSGESDALAGRFREDGHWSRPPLKWETGSPDELLQEQNLLDCVDKTLDKLPANQRAVLELRDIHGLELDAICNMLEITSSNVRVLLHRARLQLFNMVDHYQGTGEC